MMAHKNSIPDYDLLAKYFAGDASTTQTKEIEKWVAEDAANKKSFDRMQFLWIQSAKDKLVKQVDVGSAWTKMQFRMNAAQKPQADNSKPKVVSIYKKTTYRLLQFAAIIIIALAINALINYVGNDVKYISKEAQLSAVTLTLPDQSEIQLNKKSKISYPEEFKGKERSIKLEGEAFFDVQRNEEKPFVIEAQFAKIKVLGTSFNVQAYNSSNVVEVTVVSGTVELSDIDNDSKKIVLTEGERGIFKKSSDKPTKEEYSDDEEVFGIENTKIIFKDTELYAVAETLMTAYNIEIEFANDKIKYYRWDATLSNSSIDEIMNMLTIAFDLTITKTNRKYIIDETSRKKE